MTANVIDTDYLIVGAGAAGMAFADALIAECDADVVMVERRHCAGGHWNDAYPFVRIHHADACYGVNSKILGTDSIDTNGPNAGFYERSSAVEICAYFQRVLEDVFLPSGQVRFFGMCDYVGDWANAHVFTSRVTGARTEVRVRRKIVDTTYLDVTVPATHTPAFVVDEQVTLMPLGQLVDLAERPSGYTIIGAGKTAMDACNWLLDNGEEPDRIRWIRPRDAWLMDRMTLQPLDLVSGTVHGLSLGIEALAEAESIDALWPELEARSQLGRLDSTVLPTMYRGAILNSAEREALTQIERVVRLGRVRRLGAQHIVLENGEIPTERGHIHIDCTATGFSHQPVRPIFESDRIVIQSLIGATQTYYAAMLGFIESTGRDDTEKNHLCPPVAQMDTPLDWIRFLHGMLNTSSLHAGEADLMAWQRSSRLNLTHGLEDHLEEPIVKTALNRWQSNAERAFDKATQFIAQATEST